MYAIDTKSVFVVSFTYVKKGELKYPARLESQTIGYYSDLKSAVSCVKSKGPQWHCHNDFAFKIHEIQEYVLNKEFSGGLQIRVYDSVGKFNGRYKFGLPFTGRAESDCRFKLGEIVEFVDFRDELRLNVGIITVLPPDKKRVKEIISGYDVRLDSNEDSYRLLSAYGKNKRNGSQVCYLFPLSGKIDETVEKNLKMMYEKSRRNFLRL